MNGSYDFGFGECKIEMGKTWFVFYFKREIFDDYSANKILGGGHFPHSGAPVGGAPAVLDAADAAKSVKWPKLEKMRRISCENPTGMIIP